MTVWRSASKRWWTGIATALVCVPALAFGQAPPSGSSGAAPPPKAPPSAEVKAGARAAAERGSAEFQAGHYAEALDLILRAESLIHAPTHVLMLARTHAAMGHLVQAKDAYLKVTRDELGPAAPPAFKRAQGEAEKELRELEPRIPTVQITVNGGTPANLTLTMDGAAVPGALVGLPLPVDPGRHVFAASADGFQAREKGLAITEGQKLALQLELTAVSAPTGSATPASAPESTSQAPAPSSASGKRISSFVLMGAGAVGIGIGAAFTALYVSKRGSANSAFNACGVGCSGPPADNVRSLDNSANVKGDVAIAGFISGGLLGAGGVALFLLSRAPAPSERDSKGTGRAMTPWIGARSAGVSGTF